VRPITIGAVNHYLPCLAFAIKHSFVFLPFFCTLTSEFWRGGSADADADADADAAVHGGGYDVGYKRDKPEILSGAELAQRYVALCEEFPIVSIEDPFDQDDWAAYPPLTRLLSVTDSKRACRTQVVGDDLTVTNPIKIQVSVHAKSRLNTHLHIHLHTHILE
jgi:hypothetical protein